MINNDFEKQQQYTQQLKSKLDDFLKDKIVFQMTSMKLSHLVKTIMFMKRRDSNVNIIDEFIASIFIDLRLLSKFKDTSISTQNTAVTMSFATSSKRFESFFLKNKYSLSRNTHKIIELYRK